MSKNLLQDMVKVKRAKLRAEMPEVQEFYPESVFSVINEKKKSHFILWLVAFISVTFLFFAISFLFSKATVTINPKVQDIVLNENLSAEKGGGSAVLPFELVAISGEEVKDIQTAEMKDVSERALGVAIIYNAFGSAPQPLSIDTRLEGSNGKMYKTKTKITIPGMTKDGKPGSVEVGIYASANGPEYNSTPLDFKIFGFKNTPKYAKVYARSRGLISGGFQGKFPVISDEEKASAISEIKTTLQKKLLAKVTEQIPSGFILFKDAVFLNTDEKNIEITSTQDNILSLKLKGVLNGILFNESKLTKKIAEKNIEKYDGSNVYLPNIRDLKFSLSNEENISLADTKNINFNLSGNTVFVWKFDTDLLLGEVLGKSKKDFSQILLQYPNVDSADLVVSPIWKSSIPSESKNIKINVNYPE
ncbi:MAG: hypothetical protein Q7K54_03155 [Candidatus Parcubacteria bacterium]|nr:hypothetical protein [Candidatus Parcubacteria bacterium]